MEMHDKEPDPYTSGQFWDNIPGYLQEQAPNKISHLLRLVDFDNLFKNLPSRSFSIADIGCGAGKVSTGLADRLRVSNPEFNISTYGYDLSPQAIAVAKKGSYKGEFICGDIRDARRAWDLALLCDIIEHVDDPEAFLRAVAERARYFVVGFAMDDNLANRMDKRRRECTIRGGHVNQFNEHKAMAIVNKFGKVLASGYINNPLSTNLKIRSVRGLFTLPFRVTLQLLSRRLKGKLFGGESIYFFVKSQLFAG